MGEELEEESAKEMEARLAEMHRSALLMTTECINQQVVKTETAMEGYAAKSAEMKEEITLRQEAQARVYKYVDGRLAEDAKNIVALEASILQSEHTAAHVRQEHDRLEAAAACENAAARLQLVEEIRKNEEERIAFLEFAEARDGIKANIVALTAKARLLEDARKEADLQHQRLLEQDEQKIRKEAREAGVAAQKKALAQVTRKLDPALKKKVAEHRQTTAELAIQKREITRLEHANEALKTDIRRVRKELKAVQSQHDRVAKYAHVRRRVAAGARDDLDRGRQLADQAVAEYEQEREGAPPALDDDDEDDDEVRRRGEGRDDDDQERDDREGDKEEAATSDEEDDEEIQAQRQELSKRHQEKIETDARRRSSSSVLFDPTKPHPLSEAPKSTVDIQQPQQPLPDLNHPDYVSPVDLKLLQAKAEIKHHNAERRQAEIILERMAAARLIPEIDAMLAVADAQLSHVPDASTLTSDQVTTFLNAVFARLRRAELRPPPYVGGSPLKRRPSAASRYITNAAAGLNLHIHTESPLDSSVRHESSVLSHFGSVDEPLQTPASVGGSVGGYTHHSDGSTVQLPRLHSPAPSFDSRLSPLRRVRRNDLRPIKSSPLKANKKPPVPRSNNNKCSAA